MGLGDVYKRQAHDTAFSKALRHELTEEKKTEIFKIIDELAAE